MTSFYEPGAARNIFSCRLFVRGFSLVVVFSVVLSVTLAVLSVLSVYRFRGVPRGICRSATFGLFSASRSLGHGGSRVEGLD